MRTRSWRGVPHSGPSDANGERDVELVVTLAHDLRSPLSSILVLAEAMRGGKAGPVSETQRRQLGLIYNAALSLCATASDVVEFARGGQQLVESRPAPFNVSEVLFAVRDMVGPIAEEKGIKLIVTPPATVCRTGHAQALSRVLLNLTTNALKFTDRGFVEIAAREVDGGRHPEFAVTDTGQGLAPATAERPGPAFGPAKDGPQLNAGTGLGLTICRRLVTAMGAELQVETRLCQGTRFYFRLDVPPVASAA
jgi:signal transduction histidine kinase